MMLRASSGNNKGATSFFRNRLLVDTLLDRLGGGNPKVLFHACSVGAEAYSFAIQCAQRGIRCACIHATDINRDFVDYAKKAQYVVGILDAMSQEERRYFEPAEEGVSPVPEIRKAVTFLPPVSFVKAAFSTRYDVVFVMNALTYVIPQEQATTIANIAKYNTRYLLVTAFHPQTIKHDLIANGYEPVTDHIEEIHNGWGDRVVANAPENHSWKIPPFSKVPDYEYKYGALFQKKTG